MPEGSVLVLECEVLPDDDDDEDDEDDEDEDDKEEFAGKYCNKIEI